MNMLGNTRDEDGQLLLTGGRVGILLMHGLGGTPVELRFVAQSLNRAGYTVLCPLMTGHGGSDLLLNTTKWTDWVASAERALDRLKEHCDQIVIGGLSAGSLAALHVAARRQDEIEGLVLYSPTLWPNGWAIPWYFPAFRLITPEMVRQSDPSARTGPLRHQRRPHQALRTGNRCNRTDVRSTTSSAGVAAPSSNSKTWQQHSGANLPN